MATRTLLREILQINKKSVYDDHRVEITFPKGEENCFDILIAIEPTSGYYAGARINFEMVLPPDYPGSRPQLLCQTPKMHHPNISGQRVCFSMVSEDWSCNYRIEHFINGILWLLNNPNHDSPLNSVPREDIRFRNAITQAINFGRYATEGFVFRMRAPISKGSWNPLLFIDTPWMQFLRSHGITPFTVSNKSSHRSSQLKQMLWIVKDRLVITLSKPAHLILKRDVEAMTGHLVQSRPRRSEAQDFVEIYSWKSLPLTGYHRNGPIVYLFDQSHMEATDTFYVRSGNPHFLMKLTVSEIKMCIQDNQNNCDDSTFRRQWPQAGKEEVLETIANPTEEIMIKLKIHFGTPFGKSIRIAQSTSHFGPRWHKDSSPFLFYKDGFWTLNMILPRGSFPFEYKYVIYDDASGRWEWETRNNRIMTVGEDTTVFRHDSWNNY